jgi:hypothetical protein
LVVGIKVEAGNGDIIRLTQQLIWLLDISQVGDGGDTREKSGYEE